MSTRRILWTAGVGLGGFFIGGMGGGIVGADLGLVWGASIGFGFGSIFDQKQPSRRTVIYWAVTFALIGIFFGLMGGSGVRDYTPVKQFTAGLLGATVGVLLGVLIGASQLWRLRRKQTSDS